MEVQLISILKCNIPWIRPCLLALLPPCYLSRKWCLVRNMAQLRCRRKVTRELTKIIRKCARNVFSPSRNKLTSLLWGPTWTNIRHLLTTCRCEKQSNNTYREPHLLVFSQIGAKFGCTEWSLRIGVYFNADQWHASVYACWRGAVMNKTRL